MNRKEWKRNKNGQIQKQLVGDICGTYFAYLRRKAKERELEFLINKEYIWDLFLKQNKKCALSGVDLIISTTISKQDHLDRTNHTASLDRIDNNKGYIEGNLQWVHKTINRMRRQYTVEEYINWCKKVAENSNDKT